MSLEFGFVSQQVEKRKRGRERERDALKRVPDASYASNIAMQAWNIGRTLERSFIYLASPTLEDRGEDIRVPTRRYSHRSIRIMRSEFDTNVLLCQSN